MKPIASPIKRQHLHDIRSNNRSRILQALRRTDACSRQELAALLDLTPASLSRISKELIADGICIEEPMEREGANRGRPSVGLQINAKGGYLIAASISSFSRLISIVDISGQQCFRKEIPAHVIESGEATVTFIGEYVERLIAGGVLERELILGASFTIPGSISAQSGALTKSILVNWPDFPIKDRLVKRLGCPVRIENNGDALCRHFLDNSPPVEKPLSNVFLVHVSAGMGASLAIEGRIVRRLADEGWINDIPVAEGGAGVEGATKLSEVASGKAILQKCAAVGKKNEPISAEFRQQIEAAVGHANQNTDETHDLFYEAGYALGVNLVTLTVATAPDAIVLAGPVLQADAYSMGVQAGYKNAVMAIDIQPTRIDVCGANYISAAENLALHEFFLTGAYGG